MPLLVSLPTGVRLIRLDEGNSQQPTCLFVATIGAYAACPLCQRRSRRVHSRYWRTLHDLPVGGTGVCLHLQARRFFSGNPRCPRRIFVERLPQLADVRAQRTQRLRHAQTHIGQAVGSRPGERLARHLQMPTSATTLLRLERATPVPQRPTPRVLGVDDWAFRRGHRDGTILFDQERHWVVDLLPDRTPETLAQWLREHPGVEIVTRDRAEAYAGGVRQGAPQAQQVSDRWHLVKNLGQALQRLLEDQHRLLKQAAQAPAAPETIPPLPTPAPPSRQQQRLDQQKACRRQRRFERYQEVRALFAQGWNLSAIAMPLNLSRKTVRQFACALDFPERKQRAARPCRIDPYQPYLRQRWNEGCHNAVSLMQEIQQQGYSGGYTSIRDLLQTWRSQPVGVPLVCEKVSPRQMAMWTLRRDADRTQAQQATLERLSGLCEAFQVANGLVQRFLRMVRQREHLEQPQTFRAWLADALSCGVTPIRRYAKGLQQDQTAVEAGLSLRWSNGPVEGSNHRLKCLKRRGYGRAKFDLLRRRVLQPTRS